MKKIIILLIVTVIIFSGIVIGCFSLTNRMIKSNNYNLAPQWVSNGVWKVRDVFYPCSLEVLLIRSIVYSSSLKIENEIDEKIFMPDLRGYSGIDVVYILKKCGYKVTIDYIQAGIYEENRVVSFKPEQGSEIEPGESIEIILEDSFGNSTLNNASPFGANVVVQGDNIFYYDGEKEGIIKTNYDFTKSEIVFDGIAEQLNAIGDYLYFYSPNYSRIYKMDIYGKDVEEILSANIRKLVIRKDNIYFTDMNDDLNLKKFDLNTKETEVLVYEFVTYFQLEDEVIYFLSQPHAAENNLGHLRINRMNTNGIIENVMKGEEIYSFYVNNSDIYYIKNYDIENGSLKSELFKYNIISEKKLKINSKITNFLIEEEYL